VKKILSTLLFLPLLSFAQDCKLKKSVDPFTHVTKLSTGFITVNKGANQVMLTIYADNKEINMLFSLRGAGEKCFGDGSTATVLFDNNKVKGNFRNSSPMNCEGSFNIMFRNTVATPHALQRFAKESVTSIRLIGNNKEATDIILDGEEKELLMYMAACLITEAKSLIK
jgi:hypothetical protein